MTRIRVSPEAEASVAAAQRLDLEGRRAAVLEVLEDVDLWAEARDEEVTFVGWDTRRWGEMDDDISLVRQRRSGGTPEHQISASERPL